FADATLGVCYGGNGDNLPSIKEVISLYKQHNITRIRIYVPDPNILRALQGTNIEVFLDIPIDEAYPMAKSPEGADLWVKAHIKPYINDTINGNVKFRYISVGNEVDPLDPSFQLIVPAIKNLQKSLVSVGLNDTKVSTTLKYILDKVFPPSTGAFFPEDASILTPLVSVLRRNGAPFMVNVHPYHGYKELKKNRVPHEFVFFGEGSNSSRVMDGEYEYHNIFDAYVDAVHVALERFYGGGEVRVVVSETGWPTAGEMEGLATIENAEGFNGKLAKHVTHGTPRRPEVEIETYVFEMFNENLKSPVGPENYWGIFYGDKSPIYHMSFQ
ncbi:Glucan endo-1,3-beta-glucosidase, partial [Linum perenne]